MTKLTKGFVACLSINCSKAGEHTKDCPAYSEKYPTKPKLDKAQNKRFNKLWGVVIPNRKIVKQHLAEELARERERKVVRLSCVCECSYCKVCLNKNK